ncbi:FAD binding domain-containing protein [Aureimonas frigidaquae]|uniref:FAD binding domain-containing protein n=1 Tax=Aureimonas frigidaquae TaxID=424757 RepID=UPI0007862FF9|nr:xanthine dehydrogenase family protein subunit M [Aureimonas frigidaquae]
MKTFDYVRADDAVAAAGKVGEVAGARFIAGGTNLLDLMKLQVETPERLVDISRLPLRDIAETGDGALRIGALVPNSDLAADPRIRRDYAVLSRALLAGASGQLRNKATTAGNLLQRTRCGYFYEPASACNKREPGAGCDGMKGFNRILAILGTSQHCIATHPSDMAVAMRLLDAVIETVDAKGQERRIPIAEFHRQPGDTPHIESSLRPDELITAVTLPKPLAGRHIYRKVRDRASYAFALLSIAAVVDMEDGRMADVRLAFGGIGTVPWRSAELERHLKGQRPDAALFSKASDLLLADAHGYGDNDFKFDLVRRTLPAVLQEATRGDGA